jgi:hypothetical protein
MTKKKASKSSEAEILDTPNVVDLEHYVPAYLTWIANKLSRGASQHYLENFDVGIETWRCLVLLAIEGSISAQQVSKVIGMDKGSVSRCFKGMQERGRSWIKPTDACELLCLRLLVGLCMDRFWAWRWSASARSCPCWTKGKSSFC